MICFAKYEYSLAVSFIHWKHLLLQTHHCVSSTLCEGRGQVKIVHSVLGGLLPYVIPLPAKVKILLPEATCALHTASARDQAVISICLANFASMVLYTGIV